MIRLASLNYYNEQPIVSDNVFDILKEYGQKQFPNNPCFDEVGAPTNKKEVKLPFQMHSMDKIKPDTNALPKYKKISRTGYICKIRWYFSFIFRRQIIYSWKSTHGMDITYLAPYLQIPNRKDITIRGELLIKEKVFVEKYSAEYKNSRNMVAGVVNAKKHEPEKWIDLDFVAYEVIVPELKPSEQMKWLQENKTITVLNETVSEISNEMLSETLVNWQEIIMNIRLME